MQRPFWIGATIIAVVALTTSGCGSINRAVGDYLPEHDTKYKSSKRLPPLEVPPDLSSASINDTLNLPGDTTYSEYVSGDEPASAYETSGVLPDYTKVRVERSGDKRWLVVRAKPEVVWPKVREFWLAQGFIIERDEPKIGIMETDWAEERSDVDSGVIRRILSRLSSSLYGSATRDKFRTRLERSPEPATTEIFVSHWGAEEVVLDEGSRTAMQTGAEAVTVWQPRSADPELEAEMLNRMLVFFGVEEQRADQLLAEDTKRPDRARMVRDSSGTSVLALQDEFSRAWRRTGLALDRVGFTVEDRDRSRGLYYVRYVDPDQFEPEEGGFFSKLKFWGDEDSGPEQSEYLIHLIGNDQSTQVIVLNTDGAPESSTTADRILTLLHEQLR